jgi:hypothetical protein
MGDATGGLRYWAGLDVRHGESFLALFNNRLRSDGLYLVAEPEAALSPTRQLTLLLVLHQLVQRGAQFIVATHSPIIMAYPHARIYVLREDGIEQAGYTDTEHFAVSRTFLMDQRGRLRQLKGFSGDVVYVGNDDTHAYFRIGSIFWSYYKVPACAVSLPETLSVGSGTPYVVLLRSHQGQLRFTHKCGRQYEGHGLGELVRRERDDA